MEIDPSKNKLRLRIWPDRILRNAAPTTPEINDGLKTLVKDMFEVLDAFKGLGLAAPQVGLPLSLLVMKLENEEQLAMINPVLEEVIGYETPAVEGCLSLPGGTVRVPRAENVIVSWTNESGEKHTRLFTGLDARVVQHELDHLKGVLIYDAASSLVKSIVKKKVMKFWSARQRKMLEVDQEIAKRLKALAPQIAAQELEVKAKELEASRQATSISASSPEPSGTPDGS